VAAVVGGQDAEPALDRVAQGDTAMVVKEREAIVERVRLLVFEHQLPTGAAVGGPVDPGGFGRTDRQREGAVVVERLDIVKVELFATGWGDVFPGLAAVDRPDHDSRSVRFCRPVETAGGPNGLAVDDVDANQAAGGEGLCETPGR
jgi:hypothetical protein